MPDAIGIPEEMLREAAKMAVCKINIDSDIRVADDCRYPQAHVGEPQPLDPRQYLTPARAAVKSMVAHKISDVLGSAWKAVIQSSFQKAGVFSAFFLFFTFFGKEAHSMPFDYDAPIDYLPYENRFDLIPASYGCPHNQCAFCSMYKDTPYREVSLLDIKQSIRRRRNTAPAPNGSFCWEGSPSA